MVASTSGKRPTDFLELYDAGEVEKILWDIKILAESPIPFGHPELAQEGEKALSVKERIKRKRRKLGVN